MPRLADIPRTSGLPLVGHLTEFRRSRMAFLSRIARENGDIARVEVFGMKAVVVNSNTLAREVLVERAEDFVKARALSGKRNPLLGKGLVTSEPTLHRRQRKLMQPAFTHSRIAGYAAVMRACADRVVERWDASVSAGDQTIDVARDMMRVTLAIVTKTMFSADVEAETEVIGDAFEAANHLLANSVGSFFRLPSFIPTPNRVALKSTLQRLDDVILRIVDERRRLGGDNGDVLSMLLAARDENGEPMSGQQIRDEAMTLFFAGHETSANALSWSFDLLAHDPVATRRLRAELDGVLGARAPTFEDLPRLPYTLAVLKEALRLRPPVYIVLRRAARDTQIGGYEIPKGTPVVINIYGMHGRSEYFPDPDRFSPERFLPENEKQIPRDAWLPFGGGARVCIGNHFALMEGQLLLARFAHAFEVLPTRSGPSEQSGEMILRPKEGLPMRLVRRTHALAA